MYAVESRRGDFIFFFNLAAIQFEMDLAALEGQLKIVLPYVSYRLDR